MKYLFCFLLFIVSISIPAFGQVQDSLIHSLLKNIQSEQVKEDGTFYKGTFPTFRESIGAPHNYHTDNTIFYTAIGTFGLRNLRPYLDTIDQAITSDIIENARLAYPGFRNKNGKPYYGFWKPEDPILPGTLWVTHFKDLFAQGDDADDSVMILMTDSSTHSEDDSILKMRMVQVANRPEKRVRSTYKRYKKIDAYNTYLGDKMPADFDFAVQCNMLYFVMDKKLPLQKQDSATIELLADMVKNKEYLKDPVFISPYYVTSPILIYHIARLMGAFKIAELEPYKAQLIADAQAQYRKNKNVMNKIILSTSLMRLGANMDEYVPEYTSIADFENTNWKKFVFFQARAAFSRPAWMKKIFLRFSYLNYYFYCPTYSKILWLENLVERKKREL